MEEHPVFLLALQEIKSKQQEWWYLSFHDWLMTKRGQEAHNNNKPVRFKVVDEFTLTDANDGNFHTALKAEADRATAPHLSLWGTLRDYGLLPFDEALFLEL